MSFAVLLFVALSALACALAAEVVVLDSSNFEHLTQASSGATTGPWLIKFYAPWCGHCKHMAPEYEKLPSLLQDEDGNVLVNVAKVDVTANRDLGTRFDIKGFPTIKLLKNGQQYTYKGSRDATSMAAFATSGYANVTPEEVREPMGFFAELKHVYTESFKAAAVDVKNGRYFTQNIMLVAMPPIMIAMFAVLFFLPEPEMDPGVRMIKPTNAGTAAPAAATDAAAPAAAPAAESKKDN